MKGKLNIISRILILTLCAAVIMVTTAFSPQTAKNKTKNGTAPKAVSQKSTKIVVVDDAGRTVEFDKPLSRVVVFNQMNSEIIRALGKGSTIVGVDANTLQSPQYWHEIDSKAVMGKSQSELDYEKIAETKPEAVILPVNGAYEEAIKKLTPFGIKVLVVTCWKNTGYEQQIRILAKAFNVEKKGEEFISFCQAPLKLISQRLKGVKKKTVYLENNGQYKTCLVGSGWNDMITSAGGENIFGNIAFAKEDSSKGSVHSFSIDPEKILLSNPSALVQIVYSTKANNGTSIYTTIQPQEMQDSLKDFVSRPGWDNLNAVKGKQVYGISAFAGNACFKIVGTCYIAKWLYPDKLKDLNPDAFFSEWLQKYQGVKPLKGHGYHLQ